MDGIRKGSLMFLGILPAMLTVLIFVSLFVYLVPNKLLIELLGAKSGWFGVMLAATLGSIALIPGFVAFPLAKILLEKNVSYMVIAVFITTLLMVGILTLPIEFNYFGKRAAIMRNVLSFIGAIIIGLIMGMFL